MKFNNDRKRESKDENITNQIQDSRCLVEDVDVVDATAQLARLGTPVVGDRVALEDCHKESADPPAEDVYQDGTDSVLEALGGKEANIEREYRSLDDRHGTGVKDLKGVHDLTLRQQVFGQREAFVRSGGTKVLMLANACDCDSDDVVDRDTKGDNLSSLQLGC